MVNGEVLFGFEGDEELVDGGVVFFEFVGEEMIGESVGELFGDGV